MERYQLIRKVFGGSDVYDSTGKQIAYSLPSFFGDGEDFYDMEGNPIGQSFESVFGGEGFTGTGGSYGFMDEEIMMGRNLYLHGELEEKTETESWIEQNEGPSFTNSMDCGDSSDMDGNNALDDF